MTAKRSKKRAESIHLKLLDILLASSGILLVSLTIFITSQSTRQPQKIPAEAEEAQIIQRVQSELQNKPLSTVCAQYEAQVISPFSNCPQGKNRLSDNQENPLFYCCR